jgi:hypothetical protein
MAGSNVADEFGACEKNVLVWTYLEVVLLLRYATWDEYDGWIKRSQLSWSHCTDSIWLDRVVGESALETKGVHRSALEVWRNPEDMLNMYGRGRLCYGSGVMLSRVGLLPSETTASSQAIRADSGIFVRLQLAKHDRNDPLAIKRPFSNPI